MESVGQRRADLSQQRQAANSERGLAPLRLRGNAADADDIAEVDRDAAELIRADEKLDPPAAVDEIEEYQLPQVAPREDATREAMLLLAFRAGLELGRLGSDRGDLLPVGEPFR